jgi:cell division protein ZapA
MDEKINIRVVIAERPYKMAVAREQEEYVRKATKLVNNTIESYSKAFNYKDHQDLFAMVALQNTTKTVRLEAERSFKDKEMEAKLRELDEILTEHLNNFDSVL